MGASIPLAAAAPLVTLRQAEVLVGLAYVPGRFDCMHLALLAQRQLFGRDVPWPRQAHPQGRRHQAAMIQAHCAELARPLADWEQAETGDGVLWTVDAGAAGRGFHIGTLFVQGGERWVLHTSIELDMSVLQRLSDCASHGLRLEGFYRWITA